MTLVKNSAAWYACYGGCWAAKWLIASPVLKRNIAAETISQIFLRIERDQLTTASPLKSVTRNLNAMLGNMDGKPDLKIMLFLRRF